MVKRSPSRNALASSVFFLTDGKPVLPVNGKAAEIPADRIIDAVRSKNNGRDLVSIHTLGSLLPPPPPASGRRGLCSVRVGRGLARPQDHRPGQRRPRPQNLHGLGCGCPAQGSPIFFSVPHRHRSLCFRLLHGGEQGEHGGLGHPLPGRERGAGEPRHQRRRRRGQLRRAPATVLRTAPFPLFPTSPSPRDGC